MWIKTDLPATVLSTFIANDLLPSRNYPPNYWFNSSSDKRIPPNELSYYKDNLIYYPDVNSTGRDYYSLNWRVDEDFIEGLDVCDGDGDGDGGEYTFSITFKGMGYKSVIYSCLDEWWRERDEEFISTTTTTSSQKLQSYHPIKSQIGLSTTTKLLIPPTLLKNYPIKTILKSITILIEPPNNPGIVTSSCSSQSPPLLSCGQGGDHQLARDSGAMQFSAGWDWSQGTPDRVTGIFDDVVLEKRYVNAGGGGGIGFDDYAGSKEYAQFFNTLLVDAKIGTVEGEIEIRLKLNNNHWKGGGSRSSTSGLLVVEIIDFGDVGDGGCEKVICE